MGKPGGSSGGGNFKGTSGNDTFVVQSLAELKSSTYDGAGGVDTLDLHLLTSGLTLNLSSEMVYKTSKSALWADHAFSGFYTDSSNSLVADSNKISGSINNIERVIGTSGNDQIALASNGFADGGAGNDYLAGGFLVGGLGNDYVNGTGSSQVLVGGTYVNGVATGDHATDWFELGGTGVVLDFEVGIDELVFGGNSTGDPSALNNATWQATTYNGVASSILTLDGNSVILAGITPDVASTIKVGQFQFQSSTIRSGFGDDVIWPSSGPSQLVFGSGSGNDIVTHFNIGDDHLIFTAGAPTSWTNVSVNGEQAIQGFYDNGGSSVTILGLTTADVSNLLIG